MELSFVLSTLQKRYVEIFHAKMLLKKVELIPKNDDNVELTIDLEDDVISFKTDSNVTISGSGDSKKLSFAINNLKYEFKR